MTTKKKRKSEGDPFEQLKREIAKQSKRAEPMLYKALARKGYGK